MNKALRYMFWGYLFIFFRIQIGIDWLADPVGYVLIASGCLRIIKQYPQAKKARMVAMIGAVISIPTVFVNLSVPNQIGWEAYAVFLSILKLFVAYFLFAVLKSVVNDYGNRALIYRTNSVYNFYITIHLSVLFVMSFSMNTSSYFWDTIIIILTLAVLIMDVTFLLLLAAIRRTEPQQAPHAHDYLI